MGKDRCFNVINNFNKWHMYQMLSESFLQHYVPDTFLLGQVDIVKELQKYQLLYIKPSYGNRGEKVYRVEWMKNGEIHITLQSTAKTYICKTKEEFQRLSEKWTGHDTFLVQKGLRVSQIDQRVFDIRVLVQKGSDGEWAISAITSRVAYANSFTTSICKEVVEFAAILSHLAQGHANILLILQRVSISAARLVEAKVGMLGEVSIDFVLDEAGKLWIIELNGSPRKSIYDDMVNLRDRQVIYQRPIEYAHYLSRLRKKS